MHIRIYDTDTIMDIARKVYFEFDINASCSISGFAIKEDEEKLIPKGELVVAAILGLYETENIRISAGKRVKIWNYKKSSIGGPIAHKIFTWELRIVEKEPRYTIWRVQ